MEKIKIILPKNFKHIVEIMVEGADKPTVPELPPVVVDPGVEEPSVEPPFPQLQNIKLLKNAESINRNTLIPFTWNGVMYLVCHNADEGKDELYNFSAGFKYLLNLDIIHEGREVRGMVQSIVNYGDELYGLFSIEKDVFLMKYRENSNLKSWDVLGEVPIPGAKDTHHYLFINADGVFEIQGRVRGAQDWPEKDPILTDRRGGKIKRYGKTPLSVLEPPTETLIMDPVDYAENDYLTDIIRKGIYGLKSIVINGKTYSFLNIFWQNSKRKTGDRTDRMNVGTGDIYPCVVRDYAEVTAWDKHVIDQTPFLHDWPHEDALDWNPQVGQLHMGKPMDMGDYLQMFLVWRRDPHYLEQDGQPPTKLYSATLDKQALIKWFDWKALQ